MTNSPPPPPPVAAALALRPFKPLTTRRDLSTSLRAFRTASTALSQVQVLQASCTLLAGRAATVLCAVFARLDEVDKAARWALQGKVVLERSYEFQGEPEGSREGAETIFKVQATMLDLQAFSTDFLALSTGPSRLDLLVLGLPRSRRALSALSASLSSLLAHYAIPHPSSAATWAAEDAAAQKEDDDALPRLLQCGVALRGQAWGRFLAERPAPADAVATPGTRRADFVAWCVEQNPLLLGAVREGGEGAGATATPRRRKREEGSWPPRAEPPSPSPSVQGELLGLGSASGGEAPPMRRSMSAPGPQSRDDEVKAARASTHAAQTLNATGSTRPPSPTLPVIDHSPRIESTALPAPSTHEAAVPPVDAERKISPEPTALEPVAALVTEPEATPPSPEGPPTVDSAPDPEVPVILLTGEGGEAVELVREVEASAEGVDVRATGVGGFTQSEEGDAGLVVSGSLVAPKDSPPSSPVAATRAPPSRGDIKRTRMLSLDGGGLLGPVPQLQLLASHLRSSPASHFSLIAGTSSSALLAVLLGRLGLDIPAALALYTRIAQSALQLDGPAGGAAARAPPRRKQGRWARWFRRQSSPVIGPEPAASSARAMAEARTEALARALAELLPGADEPFFRPGAPHGGRTALLAFLPPDAASSTGSKSATPTWLCSDHPSPAGPSRGLTVAQAILASAAASPLFVYPSYCPSATSLCAAERVLDLCDDVEREGEVEVVSVGTGYASLWLPPPSRTLGTPSQPGKARRVALEAAQQAAAANGVAAAALASKLDAPGGRIKLVRIEPDNVGGAVMEGGEEWGTGTAAATPGRGATGGASEADGDASPRAALAPVTPFSPTFPRPLKKRASRLSFFFLGGSSTTRKAASSASPLRSHPASSSASQPRSPPPPASPLSPSLTVPRLRTSISLDDLRRGADMGERSSSGAGAGLYSLGEEAWGSSASVRSR